MSAYLAQPWPNFYFYTFLHADLYGNAQLVAVFSRRLNSRCTQFGYIAGNHRRFARVVDKVAGRVPILVDGGVRRGTDVVKALAYGANAILIGRPYLYGLAVAGQDGVERVVDILRNELELAMDLLGRPTIRSINRSVLWDVTPA